MKAVLIGLAVLALVYFFFLRKGALGASLLPIPQGLTPNGGAPTGTGGAAGRSNIKVATDIALTGGCAYATGGTGAPLCAAAAPFVTNVLGTVGSKTVSVAKTVFSPVTSLFSGGDSGACKAAKSSGNAALIKALC